MTASKKIYANKEFWFHKYWRKRYKETDIEYIRADTVIDPDKVKQLVEAMYLALNLLEVYGAENSKDYRAIKKVYDEFDKE
jgi:hypothetical protein